MKDFEYQTRAIDELTDKAIRLLNEDGNRQKLVFEAPTGSGKTVMACQALASIVDTLKADGRNRYEDVAFIWFAPRKLHLQSYNSLKGAFADGRELRPVMFDGLDKSEGIQPGEILFVNWESVCKDNNIMAREGESSPSIYEVCRITREQMGLPIIAIIDEEHMFWSKTADKSAAVLDRIDPKVEIRISATPKTRYSNEKVRVSRQDVIEAGMIKREVLLNGDISNGISDETTLNNHLMAKALEKRDQLAQAYRALGVDINPLLLIQLPNDTKETMTTEDTALAEFVEHYLKVINDITTENGRLAIWLANRKDNLADISEPDNMAEVLLFKEAIALGWDCPRAAVLLIFRKLSGNEFTIQTVGRILRMPEHHHYTDERLNIGYVYTDIAKDKINVITADADYIKRNLISAFRRPDIENVTLKSYYAKRPNDTRNYLGPDFRDVLYKESETFWKVIQPAQSLFSLADLMAMRGEDEEPKPLDDTDDDYINENRRRVSNTLRLDVGNIKVQVPKDIHFQNQEQVITIDESARFTQDASVIDRVFISFISGYVSGFENKNQPADKLASYLLETIEDFFGIFGTDAKRVVLYHENRPKFDRLIRIALDRYVRIREVKKNKAAARSLEAWDWSVPEERQYDDETHHTAEAVNHALMPFVEQNRASAQEKEFVEFLEANAEYIDWWYKNGDGGRQNYAVPYKTKDGATALFYVDFVIRLRCGKIFLFDTKTANSDMFAADKHNALINYMAEEKAKGIDLTGGVIIKEGESWLWSRFTLEDTADHQGWDQFDPKLECSTL